MKINKMNKVVIKINELGPVKNQEIELKPVLLFTGESSLGKSYVNFLAYYLFYVFSSERMFDFLLEKIGGEVNDKKEFSFDLKSADLIDWMQNDVRKFFVYLYNFDDFKCGVKFDFKDVEENFVIKYTRVDTKNNKDKEFFSFNIELNGKKIRSMTLPQLLEGTIGRVICQQLCRDFLGIDIRRSYLLPPGRASLLTGDYTVQRGSSKLGLYDLFLRDNDRINSMLLNRWRWFRDDKQNEFFVSQIHNLIKGDLLMEKDNLYLVTEDRQRIPLGAAASSIKELTPLLQLILGGSISNTAICIEEPEAHLHPEMQISVVDLLSACINENAFMQITTHSDYFLQRVNQLLKYGCIKEQNPNRYQEICDETGHRSEYYLDRDNVGAYFFSSENGKTKIEPLTIGKNGIPMTTFFNAVGILSKEEESLDNELEKLGLK